MFRCVLLVKSCSYARNATPTFNKLRTLRHLAISWYPFLRFLARKTLVCCSRACYGLFAVSHVSMRALGKKLFAFPRRQLTRNRAWKWTFEMWPLDFNHSHTKAPVSTVSRLCTTRGSSMVSAPKAEFRCTFHTATCRATTLLNVLHTIHKRAFKFFFFGHYFLSI
jgi:hypothetical protein